MPNPYGDLGQHLKTFEETLTLVQRGDVQVTDGYMEEQLEDARSFRGVVVPAYMLQAREEGVHLKGDTFLYVRITQEGLPDIKIQDIVQDEAGQKWKVLAVDDYSKHGQVKLYDIQKVEGTC